MLCKNCGKRLNDNTTICPVCGKTTGATVKSQRVQSQQSRKINSHTNDNTTPKRYCSKCGNAIAPDAKFCLHCGCDLNNSYNPQPNYFKPQDGRFVAIMKTNKKRNILIAIILMLFIVIITFILFRIFESNESKIQGKWLIYSVDTELVDKEDQVTWDFSNGRLLISSVTGTKTEEGYYTIDGDTLEIYDDDYRENKLMGSSKRYVIEKLSSNELILRKINTDKTIVFKG